MNQRDEEQLAQSYYCRCSDCDCVFLWHTLRGPAPRLCRTCEARVRPAAPLKLSRGVSRTELVLTFLVLASILACAFFARV